MIIERCDEPDVYLDCGHFPTIEAYRHDIRITGFTTNLALARAAGVTDYRDYVLRLTEAVGDRPVAFQAAGREIGEIAGFVRRIHRWSPQAFVKVPVVTGAGGSIAPAIGDLLADGIRLNITAIFTPAQAESVLSRIPAGVEAVLSVFAGRIADTGRDPVLAVREISELVREFPAVRVLWASARQVYDFWQAGSAGADIITLTPDLVERLRMRDRDLTEFSASTVAELTSAGDAFVNLVDAR